VQQLKADDDYWRARAETAVSMPSAWPAPSTDATWLAPPSPVVGMPWNTSPAPPPPPMMTAASPGFAAQRPPVSRRGHRGRGRGRGRALVNRDQCRICYQPGHWSWSYNCPQQQSRDPDNANVCGVSSPSQSSSVTYTYMNVILNRTKTNVCGVSSPSQSSSVTYTYMNVILNRTKTNVCGVSSPSQSSSVTYTYMNVILNRTKTVAFIDSGSEKNLIPSRLVQGVIETMSY